MKFWPGPEISRERFKALARALGLTFHSFLPVLFVTNRNMADVSKPEFTHAERVMHESYAVDEKNEQVTVMGTW